MTTKWLKLKENITIKVTEDTQYVLTLDESVLNGTP
jgi:hypothetical protein